MSVINIKNLFSIYVIFNFFIKIDQNDDHSEEEREAKKKKKKRKKKIDNDNEPVLLWFRRDLR